MLKLKRIFKSNIYIYNSITVVLVILSIFVLVRTYEHQSDYRDVEQDESTHSVYDSEQMEEIRRGLESKVDVGIYADVKYDGAQMCEIREGLESGVDTTIYSDPEIPWQIMQRVRLDLEDETEDRFGIDFYSNPEFDWEQLEEIRLGLEASLDTTIYAKPEFTWAQMEQIRWGLEDGVDTSVYAKAEINEIWMYYIRKGLIDGFDLSPYVDSRFDEGQVALIYEGMLYGVKGISIYANPIYSGADMTVILKGLKNGYDVEKFIDSGYSISAINGIIDSLDEGCTEIVNYITPEMDRRQISQISKGIQNGVDVSVYAKTEYTDLEMFQIRRGLESDVDISVYSRLEE